MTMRTFTLLTLGVSLLIANCAAAGVVLVREGQSPALIVIAADAAPLEKTAAQQLAAYLKQISGATFVVQAAKGDLPATCVCLGNVDPALAKELPPDGFRIVTREGRLHLVGGSSQAVMCAVFALLEDQLGCRWWTYNEEDVPGGKTTIELVDVDRTYRPSMPLHNVWNREAQSPQNHFLYKRRSTSAVAFNGGHTLYPLLDPYGKTHPEIYPQDKSGERKWNNLHFCYLAPGIVDALTDALGKQIAARPDGVATTIYFAGMGDWYGGQCQCEMCQRVYEEEAWTDPDGRKKPGYTATLLRMINATAEKLEKRFPGVKIGTFAYMSLEAPPAKTVPRENVVIRVPRLRHCGVHPARECDKNRSYLRNIERWAEIAPQRVYVWEYGVSFKNLIGTFPCLYSMADNLRLYHELGLSGVDIQGNYVTTGSDLVALKNYVWSKTLWQPERDPRGLVAEFCRGYYGPAGDAMMAFVDRLERTPREPMVCADEFSSAGAWLKPDAVKELTALRDAAVAKAAGDETFERRVREGVAGFDAFSLWRAGPLEEQGGKLVRTDLGGDSLPRAEELVRHIRGGTPSEFSNGVSWRQRVLLWHGGPLVTLHSGDLTAKIAPLLNGQIRQLEFRGQQLLFEEPVAAAKNYPLVGGSLIDAGSILMKLDSEPTSDHAVMSGDAGIGAYNTNVKQHVRLTTSLAGNSLKQTGTVERVAKVESDTRGAVITTVYRLGGKATTASVLSASGDGGWQAVELPTDGKEVALEKLDRLKIILPAAGCEVVDRYRTPAGSSAKIQVDLRRRSLTTTVTTPAVAVPEAGTAEFLAREISVAPSS